MSRARKISVTEAKSHFLELVRLVQIGRAFEISKSGKAVARLVPASTKHVPRTGFAEIYFDQAEVMKPLPIKWSVEDSSPVHRKLKKQKG